MPDRPPDQRNRPGPPDRPDDPFENLFGRDEPATPRAAFAEQLRRRLEGELRSNPDHEMENPMSTRSPSDTDIDAGPDPEADAATGEHPAPAPDTTISPIAALGPELVNPGSLFYFTLPGPDVDRSARFYREVFGWDLRRGAQGYHVEGVYPPMGLASNDSTDAEVWIEVTDIEAAVAKVRSLGGQAEDPVRYDSGYSSACVDPQGVRFNLSVPIDAYRSPARASTEPGELFYWTIPAPDAEESKAFYREVFGWEYSGPGEQGGVHVTNRLPDGGLGGGREGTAPELFFRVGDLDAAMAAVRSAGGTAEPIGEGPEGRHAACTDDQGVPFGISQPSPGPAIV